MLIIQLVLTGSNRADSEDYYTAAKYYEDKNYSKALEYYRKAIKENQTFLTRYPQIQLKISYCLFKTHQYEEAREFFQRNLSQEKFLQDYSDLFAIKSELMLGDTSGVIRNLHRFKGNFPQSPLIISADSMMADLYFKKAIWDTAYIYNKRLLKYRGFDRGDIYGRLIKITQMLKRKKSVENYVFDLIGKYPFHPQSKKAFDALNQKYSKRLIPAKKLKSFFRYLGKTGQFKEIDRLLNVQTQIRGKTEQIRWLKIRKLYLQKKYWAAFQACKDQRKNFRQLKYLREVDLHIARCSLRLGFVDKAIKAYDVFQKRFPTDRLAPEVLWVIAWLCEERGHAEKALQFYKRLIFKYPRYQFNNEAKFRIGLLYYRQADYETARWKWEKALTKNNDEDWKTRYKFWIAKSYAQEDSIQTYLSQLKEISHKPFDSYYNLKAFLLTKNGVQIRQFVDSLVWEMNHKQTSYLPRYLEHFQKPLLVQEIFGDWYAQKELSQMSKKLDLPSWEMLFALGEVNDRLQNFGKAYRLYRKVYLENFLDRDWQEWIFLFKYLYPLYFNGEVNKYARKYNLSPASIWAVMKKESAFESQITSYANAYGLMQIIPPTADRLSGSLGEEFDDVRRLFDPKFNINLGSYYLSELLKRYDGNLYYALAAYNAGEHRVDRWRKVLNTEDDDFFMENIEFEQTRSYVRGVMKFYWTYHLLIHPYKISEDMVSFPEKVARDPWFRDTETNDSSK